jgi:rare lipoprotein A
MNKLLNFFVFAIIALNLSGCSPNQGRGLYTSGNPKKYQGYYKSGRTYSVFTGYRNKHFSNYTQSGVASWYGANDGFHGKITANGDYFISNGLTAAHKTLPLPCLIRVTNLENGKRLIVMVNDRGPYHGNRLLDLSERAADILKIKRKGTGRVRIDYLPDSTKKLLKKLSLKPVNGYYAKTEMLNKECSVQCYLNYLNRQKNYIGPHEDIQVAEISKYPHYSDRVGVNSDNNNSKIYANNNNNHLQNYIVRLDLSGLKSQARKNKIISYLDGIHKVSKHSSSRGESAVLGPFVDETHAVKIAVHLEELTKLDAEIEFAGN